MQSTQGKALQTRDKDTKDDFAALMMDMQTEERVRAQEKNVIPNPLNVKKLKEQRALQLERQIGDSSENESQVNDDDLGDRY